MTTGMATVNAADFNFASSDNCTATADLSFAFSSDINNTAMVVTCDELGANAVEMWVFDADGLTDFCSVTLTVQNNNGLMQTNIYFCVSQIAANFYRDVEYLYWIFFSLAYHIV